MYYHKYDYDMMCCPAHFNKRHSTFMWKCEFEIKRTTSTISRLHVPEEVKPFKAELFSSAVKLLKAAYWSRRTSMSI